MDCASSYRFLHPFSSRYSYDRGFEYPYHFTAIPPSTILLSHLLQHSAWFLAASKRAGSTACKSALIWIQSSQSVPTRFPPHTSIIPFFHIGNVSTIYRSYHFSWGSHRETGMGYFGSADRVWDRSIRNI